MSITKKFMTKQKTIKQEIEDWKLQSKAERKLLKADIPAPKRLKRSLYLDFPDDVTEIPDKELGHYLGIYESQAAWISYCRARREIDLEHGRILLDYVYAKLLISKEGKTTEQKAQVEADPFYNKCKLEFLEIEADLKMLNASLESCERYAKTISREITNRKDKVDYFPQRRTGSVLSDKQGEEVFHDHNSRK